METETKPVAVPPFFGGVPRTEGARSHDGAVCQSAPNVTVVGCAVSSGHVFLPSRLDGKSVSTVLHTPTLPPPSRPLGSCSDPPRPTATKCFNQLPVPPLEPFPSPRLADVLRRASLGPYKYLYGSTANTHTDACDTARAVDHL